MHIGNMRVIFALDVHPDIVRSVKSGQVPEAMYAARM